MLEWSPLWFYCSSQNIKSRLVFSSLVSYDFLSYFLASWVPSLWLERLGPLVILPCAVSTTWFRLPTRLSSKRKKRSMDIPSPLAPPSFSLEGSVFSYPWASAWLAVPAQIGLELALEQDQQNKSKWGFPHALCIRDASFFLIAQFSPPQSKGRKINKEKRKYNGSILIPKMDIWQKYVHSIVQFFVPVLTFIFIWVSYFILKT